MKYKISYEGALRTRMEHEGSGERLQTDAPQDNQGEGKYFSPTDLVAASLASCMMTIIGITAQSHGFEIDKMEATAEKIMTSGPRRISEIHVELHIATNASEQQRRLLTQAALNCPVAKSLAPEINQQVEVYFT